MSVIETAAPRTPRRTAQSAPWMSEDWLSVVIGLLIFVMALAVLANVDLIGWVVTTSVWSNFGQALGTVSKLYAPLGGVGGLLATYVALLVVLSAAAAALDADVKKFAPALTAVFWIAYASWVVGSYANFAAVTPADLQKFGISWSLRLTNEGGFIFALMAGLIIANFFPRFAERIKEAVRPELYIKIAIVILGGFFAVTAAGKLNLATSLLLRGIAAIIEVPDLLGRGLFRRPQMVRIQPRMGRPACLGHLDLRRGGGHRHRRSDPRAPGRSGAGLFAGGRLCGSRGADPAVPGADLPLEGTVGRRGVDRPCYQDRRRRGRRRRHHRVANPSKVGRGRRDVSAGLDARNHRNGEGVHRRVHRHLGLYPRLYLDKLRQRNKGQGDGGRDLATFPEISFLDSW